MFDKLRHAVSPKPASTGTSFLPEDYLQQRIESRANVVSLLLFGTVLFGVVGAFFVTNRAWTAVRERQHDINAQYTEQTKRIEQLKQLEAQKAEMLDKAEITTALIERVPRSILLAELINRMPDKVTLTDLQLTSKRLQDQPAKDDPKNKPQSIAKNAKGKDGKDIKAPAPRPRPPRMEFTINLVGLSATDEAVADFQAALKECALLQKVDLVSSQETIVENTAMRKWRIEAQIKPEADARKIEPLAVPRLKPVQQGNEADGRPTPAPPAPVASGEPARQGD